MELYSHNGGLRPRQGGPVQGRPGCASGAELFGTGAQWEEGALLLGVLMSDEHLAKLYLAKFFTDLVGGLTVFSCLKTNYSWD